MGSSTWSTGRGLIVGTWGSCGEGLDRAVFCAATRISDAVRIFSLSQFLTLQHAVGAVHRVRDQFTETGCERKTTLARERPRHSPVESHEVPGDEGKSPAPRRQKTDCSMFKVNEGQAYRVQTKPNPSQRHPPEKTIVEQERFGVSFAPIGPRLTFAQKEVEKTSKRASCMADETTSTTCPRKTVLCCAKNAHRQSFTRLPSDPHSNCYSIPKSENA